jgi:hypothetical protein
LRGSGPWMGHEDKPGKVDEEGEKIGGDGVEAIWE